jgi:hypothetical protein
MSRGDLLRRLGFRDLGEVDEANEAAFSIAEIPNWTVVFSNDFEYGAAGNIRGLSRGSTVVACQVEEHVMVSATHCLTNGALSWSVRHDGGEHGPYDLHVDGELPAAFDGIKRRLHAEQDADGGAEANVDLGFDIPLELAMDATGYRHDQLQFSWGEPTFTVIERRRLFNLPFLRSR